jgi:hypothetical protein
MVEKTFLDKASMRFIPIVCISLLMLCSLTNHVKAQCNFSIINLPDTLSVCKNNNVSVSPSLLSTGGAPSYLDTLWTPASGLSNPNILNPNISVGTTSTNYILTVTGVTPNNLIANGDFSLGNTIFSSSYVYGTGGTWGLLSSEAQYAISTNPQLTHTNFASFGDHTTGSGNMMVVNGASVANVNIWCQTIPVTPNTDYDFSAWGATCVASNPAILQFSINGVLIGTPLALPISTGVWTPFHAVWNSGSNTSITICITDQATAFSGNDFAIDDISFRQICYVQDSVYVKAINLTPSIQQSIYLGCEEDSIQFNANNGSGNIPSSYTWDLDAGFTSNVQNPFQIYPIQGNYIIKLVTELEGCKDSTFTTVNTLHPMDANFSAPDTVCTNVPCTPVNLSSATGSYVSIFDWGDGSIDQQTQHSYSQQGSYTITLYVVDSRNCMDSFKHPIEVLTLPIIDLPQDTVLCAKDMITLQAITNVDFVQWQDGSNVFFYKVHEPGVYYATVSNFCGISADTTHVLPKDCACLSFIPTAFTPNNDGLNDNFQPKFFNCDISNYTLTHL